MVQTKCIECSKEFFTNKCWVKRGSGKFCSKVCHYLWRSKHFKGEKHPLFNPKTTNYAAVHDWMLKTFGKANKCESLKCKKDSKGFVWALKKGKIYERKRQNFKRLCYKCHFQYDFNEGWRSNMIKGQQKRRYG